MTCPDCKGRGYIELFLSSVECKRCATPAEPETPELEPGQVYWVGTEGMDLPVDDGPVEGDKRFAHGQIQEFAGGVWRPWEQRSSFARDVRGTSTLRGVPFAAGDYRVVTVGQPRHEGLAAWLPDESHHGSGVAQAIAGRADTERKAGGG